MNRQTWATSSSSGSGLVLPFAPFPFFPFPFFPPPPPPLPAWWRGRSCELEGTSSKYFRTMGPYVVQHWFGALLSCHLLQSMIQSWLLNMLSEPFPRPPPCITQGVLNKAQLFEFDAITQLSRHLQRRSAVHLEILSPQTTGSKPGPTFSKLELFVFTLKGQFDSNTWPIRANRWA